MTEGEGGGGEVRVGETMGVEGKEEKGLLERDGVKEREEEIMKNKEEEKKERKEEKKE